MFYSGVLLAAALMLGASFGVAGENVEMTCGSQLGGQVRATVIEKNNDLSVQIKDNLGADHAFSVSKRFITDGEGSSKLTRVFYDTKESIQKGGMSLRVRVKYPTNPGTEGLGHLTFYDSSGSLQNAVVKCSL